MIQIDARSNKPIYEQIVDGIKEKIMKGVLVPGEKIPSVREMSKTIMANPNTVSKAYMELERQNVIETLTGRGTYVSMNYKPCYDEEKVQKIKKMLKDIVVEAHYMGLYQEGLVEILKDIYKDMERE